MAAALQGHLEVAKLFLSSRAYVAAEDNVSFIDIWKIYMSFILILMNILILNN